VIYAWEKHLLSVVQTGIVRMIYHLTHDDRNDRKIRASADTTSGVV